MVNFIPLEDHSIVIAWVRWFKKEVCCHRRKFSIWWLHIWRNFSCMVIILLRLSELGSDVLLSICRCVDMVTHIKYLRMIIQKVCEGLWWCHVIVTMIDKRRSGRKWVLNVVVLHPLWVGLCSGGSYKLTRVFGIYTVVTIVLILHLVVPIAWLFSLIHEVTVTLFSH